MPSLLQTIVLLWTSFLKADKFILYLIGKNRIRKYIFTTTIRLVLKGKMYDADEVIFPSTGNLHIFFSMFVILSCYQYFEDHESLLSYITMYT